MKDELDDMINEEANRQASESGDDLNDPNNDNTTTDDNNPGDGEGNEEEQGADAPVVPAKPAAAAQQAAGDQSNAEPFDAQLERFSNGVFKTPAQLLDAVTKLNGFDDLNKEVQQLRDQVSKAPKFADEFEQKRNELKLSGASKETLKTFEKLNDLGDLNTLDPLEAKVMKLVLVDGMSEKVARLKVERQFPMEDTHDEDEIEIMKEDLRISAASDLKALQAYKVEITTPTPNDSKLLSEAGKAQLNEALTPALATFTSSLQKLTTLNLGPDKEGVPAVALDVPVTESDKKFFEDNIKEYMLDNGLPLTTENFNEARQVATEKFVALKLPEISNLIWKTADAHYAKFYSEKYENPGGKPRSEGVTKGNDSAKSAEIRNFENNLLGGEFK